MSILNPQPGEILTITKWTHKHGTTKVDMGLKAKRKEHLCVMVMGIEGFEGPKLDLNAVMDRLGWMPKP